MVKEKKNNPKLAVDITARNRERNYSQVQNKWGGRGHLNIFRDFWRPPAAYFDPPFINFSNFSRGYTEVDKYITDS